MTARHICQNWIRKQYTTHFSEGTFDPPDPGPSQTDLYDQRDIQVVVLRLVRKLPRRTRMILRDRYGLRPNRRSKSYRELATQWQSTEQAMRLVVHSAIKELRERLREHVLRKPRD